MIFGISYILAGYSSGSYPALILFIGITGATGVGLCYICPIACSVKWFPNHKSLATGIAVAGFGGSAIIISQTAEYFLAQQVGVLTIFKYMGLIFFVVITIAAMFLKNPPQDQSEALGDAAVKITGLIRDRNFLGLLCGIFPCLCIGLMTIGNIKPFGLSLNLSIAAAGTAVSILALFNAIGRISWGYLVPFWKARR
jgi:OFA family oxalate/formate antiporter-like MFS transporter